MMKLIAIFILILLAATGCKANDITIGPSEKKADAPIAVHQTLPEALSLPTYPETPLTFNVKEYKDGWTVEQTVGNSLVIARPAWLERFTETGWEITHEIATSDGKIQWFELKKDGELMFIQFHETKLEQKNTDDQEEEPLLIGETEISTYVKK